MDQHMLLDHPGFGPAEMSGRSLASCLVLSQTLRALVEAGVLDQKQVHKILEVALERVHIVRDNLKFEAPPVELEKLQTYAEIALSLIRRDVDENLRLCTPEP